MADEVRSRGGRRLRRRERGRPRRRAGLSQGAARARRDRVRRERDRAAAGVRDRPPLPRRAGGALLRAPRPDPDDAQRRQHAPCSARAAWRAWTPPPSARSRTSATSPRLPGHRRQGRLRGPRRPAARGRDQPRRARAHAGPAARDSRRCVAAVALGRRWRAPAADRGHASAAARSSRATTHWNQRVDKLPVHRELERDRALDRARRARCTPTSARGSTRAGRSASRSSRSARGQPQGAGELRLRRRVRPRAATRSRRGAPIEGGPRRRRRPPRDRRRPLALPPLRAVRRLPAGRRRALDAPARARSGTCARTACARAAGPRPTPPACRSCRASPATTRSSAAASTTRCGSPRSGRAGRSSTRRATSPRTRPTPTCRRWASGCACGAATTSRASRARRGSCCGRSSATG